MNKKCDLVSIVVPIYNVAQYLQTCLDSIISQTYSNLEIILVDDGSTDSCPEQCDQYAIRDERIKVIHQKNEGLSVARNTGLKHSNGKYIAFIDSDDVISKDMIEKLYIAITHDACQVSCCKYVKFEDEENINFNYNTSSSSNYYIYNNIDALSCIYLSKISNIAFTAWNKLYNRELFFEHNILYPDGKLYEDIFTTYKLIFFSNKVAFIEDELYFYRQRTGSIMNQELTMKRLDALEGHKECLRFFDKYNQKYLLSLEFNSFCNLSEYLYRCANNSTEIKREIIKVFRNEWGMYSKNVCIGFTKHLFYYLFNIAPDFISSIMKIIFLMKERLSNEN